MSGLEEPALVKDDDAPLTKDEYIKTSRDVLQAISALYVKNEHVDPYIMLCMFIAVTQTLLVGAEQVTQDIPFDHEAVMEIAIGLRDALKEAIANDH